MRPASFSKTRSTLATPDNVINSRYSFEAPSPASWRRCSIAVAHIPFGRPPTGDRPFTLPAGHGKDPRIHAGAAPGNTIRCIDRPLRRSR